MSRRPLPAVLPCVWWRLPLSGTGGWTSLWWVRPARVYKVLVRVFALGIVLVKNSSILADSDSSTDALIYFSLNGIVSQMSWRHSDIHKLVSSVTYKPVGTNCAGRRSEGWGLKHIWIRWSNSHSWAFFAKYRWYSQTEPKNSKL